MARPRSGNKSTRQKPVAGGAKRRHGGGHVGGGAGGRPAKQSRREKQVDRDVYEAEDSDPDEVKHAKRFDQVDNYEYELPSDFEDEEIDEELAFTAEDKKKFGGWFDKEVSGDELGDEDLDGDDEEDGNVEEEDDGLGEEDGEREEGAEDDLDDLFLDGDDEEDDIGEEEDGDDALDDERHRAMLADILGPEGSRKRARRDPNAAVVSEAYPESEYNLNPGAASAGGAAGSMSVADLLKGLTPDERRKLGAARRLLEKFGGSVVQGGRNGAARMQPVAVPLPAVVAERQERKAGYEAATQDVSKWQSIVKANREVPTLRLVAGRQEVPRVSTTAALVAQHTPSADNALEAEVAALLEAAGADNAGALEEAEEELALKAMTLEEARERRQRLAKMRSLLFYHELKARRLKAIKSKEYHRHLARAAKRKAAKLAAAQGEDGDVEAERAAAIEAEYQRAKERLTQRHRNSSRWARRALLRGQQQMDAGTKAALAEQLQLGQELKRKIEGRKANDDDGSTSASDVEAEGEGGVAGARRRGAARVRSAALEILSGKGPLDPDEATTKKGLLALPFMKRAMERRRLAAEQEAQQLLQELDEQQLGVPGEEDNDEDQEAEERTAAGANDGSRGILDALVGYGVPSTLRGEVTGASGRRRFGGAIANATANDADGADAEGSELDSDDMEDAEAKAERLGRPTREAAAATTAGKATRKGRGGKGDKAGGLSAPPTAAEQEDLDAAIRAGAAGRGFLVSSADVGVGLAVAHDNLRAGTAEVEEKDDMDAERRQSGRNASSRGVLSDVATLQGSMAAGGGRAALFKVPATGASGVKDGKKDDGAQQGAKFMPSKSFTGAQSGYVYKRGPQGLGYYLDAKAPAQSNAAAGASKMENGNAKLSKQLQQESGKAAAGEASAGVAVAGQAKQPPQQQQEQQRKPGTAEQKAGKTGKADQVPIPGSVGGVDDDEDDVVPIMRPTGQRDLIRQAFAGDDVEAEFAAEKAAAVADELPTVDGPSAVPGWGAWASQQRNPKWMQTAKDRAAKLRADAAAGRKDAALKYVVISEKWDKKAAKYTVPSVPFPFTSKEAYERSLRQPLGREYNPDTAFRDLTRPAVLKQAGVTIAPLRYSENVAKDLGKKGKKAEAKREATRVMTVAGGMARAGGK